MPRPPDRPDPGLDPLFRTDGEVLVPSPSARGPWFEGVLHGGAVAGVMTRAVEALPSAVPMALTRLTVDLSRKVPLAPLRIDAEIVRDGRRLQSAAVVLHQDGTVVSRATALRLRVGDDVVPASALAPPDADELPPGQPEDATPISLEGARFAFVRCFEMRRVGEAGPGRGAVWYRFRAPLVDDEPLSPAVRVAMTADLTMSAASIVGFDRYLAANPDLTVQLLRPPADPWLCLRSRARVDGSGIGQSDGELFDRQGLVGRAMKTLLVDPR